MSKYSGPRYDAIKNTIKNMKANGKSWKSIISSAGTDNQSLEDAIGLLKSVGVIESSITLENWVEITQELQKVEKEEEEFREAGDRTILISDKSNNDARIPKNPHSSWQLYKSKLVNDGWSVISINELENTTLDILKKLNQDTTVSGPVKGLVIGNVQSGKTANMAGLMAMAADHGWNMFVVLSGLIDNLRKQTEERLIGDLNHAGTLAWQALDNPAKRPSAANSTQNLHFGEQDRRRYLTVCLKHKTRLENLLKWLYADENKLRQMKILVIDDEADQAGINTLDTEKEERARINSLIVELVNGKKENNARPKAMNYLSYTATPYANVLNETTEESLYPKDFIGLLKTPAEYFGPKEIFGLYETEEYSGLNIIRDICQGNLEEVSKVHEGKSTQLPSALQKAVIWFYCASAVQRFRGYKKPVSMLIHTSQQQAHHKYIAESIEGWLNSLSEKEFLKQAKTLYEEEKSNFTKDDFRKSYPEYGIPDENINDYPNFEDIIVYVSSLKNRLSHIELNEEGDLQYHAGTHLCIDNCANNGLNDENTYVRLAYPDKNSSRVESDAPAFIIIGGSTLSRGLTIEGLVSTFFLRSTKQGDTLMQMGRWFGYRKGYELLPRIWMTEDTQEKFRFLASLEYELREDLRPFLLGTAKPNEVGPRIKNSPQLSWLRITAKNRMQNAVETELDFSGTSSQTVVFKNDKEVLKNNIRITEDFLNSLDKPKVTLDKVGLLWEYVPFEKVEAILTEYVFESSPVFDQIEAFIEWYKSISKEEKFTGWNVIVGGRGKVDENEEGWQLNSYNVGKVARTRKGEFSKFGDRVSIGVLKNPSDVYKDFDMNHLKHLGIQKSSEISDLSVKTEEVHSNREEVGLGKTPQLLIYRVDAKSTTRTASADNAKKHNRFDLEFDEDIIGISILVPGKKNRNLAKKLTVQLKRIEENETEGDFNEN
ncbi:Z1 domain-containing protein [Planococcus alpniumensis]|uniref:Z1 domain-containing protein n=1 Tax=Planococcus alpniumensis TaxID=2708345 RepID=UPI001B8B90A3|nr:Z1 domain-containing protein [Planococcus sp. MSAK28401]